MKTFFHSLVVFLLVSTTAVATPIQSPIYQDVGSLISNSLKEAPSILTAEDIIHYADQLDFDDPKLVASIAKVESDLQPKARNFYKGVTYYGLMQISYETAKMVGFSGKPKELMNWRVNVKYATKYLKVLKEEHGTIKKTIAAYNAGTVYYCQFKCPRGQFVNAEYVNKVMKAYGELHEDTPSET